MCQKSGTEYFRFVLVSKEPGPFLVRNQSLSPRIPLNPFIANKTLSFFLSLSLSSYLRSMRTHKNPKRGHGSIKTRFAIKFVRAMNKLKKRRPPSSVSPSMAKRYQYAIRAAASASMASAVGPKRAWSRAVLRKIRSRHINKHQDHVMMTTTKNRKKKRLSVIGGNPTRQEDDLRGLVPGGQGMDICRLFNETAHYIHCLRAQVQVMTNVLDHYSS